VNRSSTVIRTGVQALVIEVPDQLSDQARANLREQLDDWAADPLRPLVLLGGARLRVLGPDGRLTPDEPDVRLWLTIGAVAGFTGAIVALIFSAVLS
jgi:hypothetical protein